jgi:hypothetical protein
MDDFYAMSLVLRLRTWDPRFTGKDEWAEAERRGWVETEGDQVFLTPHGKALVDEHNLEGTGDAP